MCVCKDVCVCERGMCQYWRVRNRCRLVSPNFAETRSGGESMGANGPTVYFQPEVGGGGGKGGGDVTSTIDLEMYF